MKIMGSEFFLEGTLLQKDHLSEEIPQVQPVTVNLQSSDSKSDLKDVKVHDGCLVMTNE